jgi:hypothetical protein
MADTLELIRFWSRQLSEHCLFLQLGLDPQDLKNEAQSRNSDWEAFRLTIPAQASPQEVQALVNKVKPMAMSLRQFKTRVYDRLRAGEWLGWLFPSFVGHIRSELDYFVAHLGGSMQHANLASVSDELCIWLKFMSEHAAFAAHLLDPEERLLIRQAQALQEKLEELEDGCKSMEVGFIVLSQKAGVLLDQYFTRNGIGTPQVESVIHPVLALHVVREGRMFLRVLEELRGQKATEEIPE